MSKFKLSSAAIAFMVSGLFIACNESEENNFTTKGSHQIIVKKGSVFTFSLPQNKSTGYELCWLNEPKLTPRFKLESIKSKLKDYNNVDGGGETITYQILAIESGTDTLHFKNCPTRLWQKECSFFTVDSIRTEENGTIISVYNPSPKGDYEIVVKVEE